MIVLEEESRHEKRIVTSKIESVASFLEERSKTSQDDSVKFKLTRHMSEEGKTMFVCEVANF